MNREQNAERSHTITHLISVIRKIKDS